MTDGVQLDSSTPHVGNQAMIAYMTDEIGFEVSEYGIPNRLAATGPKWGTNTGQMIDDAHLVGAVEGWIAGWVQGQLPNDDYNMLMDDEEYPARRVIHRQPDGTIVLNARFGRNKKWVMAFNREDNAKAKAAIEAWIVGETASGADVDPF